MDNAPQPCVSDLNDEPVFPRIGKLRLGIKHESANGNSHPANTNYFTFHCGTDSLKKRFVDLYGERPAAIRICLLSEDIDKVFPNNLTWYRGMVVCCKGDNRTATRAWKDVEPEIQKALKAPASHFTKVTIPCPCPRKGDPCTLQGRFNVMLPEIQPAASVEVITGSIVNLKEIRGVLRSYKELLGRISFVPFTLSRHAVRMQFQGKSAVQYLLQLVYQGDLAAINDLRASCGLPPLPCSSLISGERVTAIAPPKAPAESEAAGAATPTDARLTPGQGARSTKDSSGTGQALDRPSASGQTTGAAPLPQAVAPAVCPESPRAAVSEGPKPLLPRASIGNRAVEPLQDAASPPGDSSHDRGARCPSGAPPGTGRPGSSLTSPASRPASERQQPTSHESAMRFAGASQPGTRVAPPIGGGNGHKTNQSTPA